jgi:predicted O-linked N-acetylglucosamine transferase (SPINDLY family)
MCYAVEEISLFGKRQMKKGGLPPGSQGSRPVLPPSTAIRASLQQAVALHQQGRLAEAKKLYRQVLATMPAQPDALHFLGVLEAQQGNPAAAADLIGRAVKLVPGNGAFHGNLGKAFLALDRPKDALASCDQAIRLQPDFAEAHFNRGVALLALDRPAEALASFDRTLQLHARNAAVFYNRGRALLQLSRAEEGLKSFEDALQIQPADADLLYNYGTALLTLDRVGEALKSFDRVLQLRPGYAEAHNNRGTALRKLNKTDEAIESYNHALQIKPTHVGALVNLGTALSDIDRKLEALDCFDRALKSAPNTKEALLNRGTVLQDMNRYKESRDSFAALLRIAPDDDYTLGNMFHVQLQCCDWSDYEALRTRISAGIAENKKRISPFALLGCSDSPGEQLQCAQIFAADKYPAAINPVWTGERYAHEKLRVAYLSADFHNHATAYLMARLFELHDRSRFEIFAYSFGPQGSSEMRERLLKSFDHFIDVRRNSDREVAQLLRDSEIDIAVDLKGYTANCRPGILAQRTAPVQVSYLGYPGTLGAHYVDYIVADRHVIPFGDEAFYTEKIVRLPGTYQVTDNKRVVPATTPSRAEMGLPETAFVFCCFNNSYKLSPTVFDIWMRLLQQIEGSVLWLLDDNPEATRNLRKEAEQRGISSTRLVFAPRIPQAEHLARHRLADLFLDTQPYTAHTTASDALWMNGPLVTCKGMSFASRVAASILHAAGLPELVTDNSQEYEALALALATTPARLAEIRNKLDRHRSQFPLFDTDRFRRHIEAAYLTMWERAQRGEAPASFSVDPVDA